MLSRDKSDIAKRKARAAILRRMREKETPEQKAKKRDKIKTFLDTKAARDNHDSIPPSRREWDARRLRWVDAEEAHKARLAKAWEKRRAGLI